MLEKNLEKSGCMKKQQEEKQSEYRTGGEGKEKGGERGKEREEQGEELWGRTRRTGVLPPTVREVDGRWWGRS